MPSEYITDSALLRDILWDDAEGYETVDEQIVGQSRWHTHVELVFRRLSDGQLFILQWSKGSTENQDHEYPDEAVSAEAYEVLVVHYRVKH